MDSENMGQSGFWNKYGMVFICSAAVVIFTILTLVLLWYELTGHRGSGTPLYLIVVFLTFIFAALLAINLLLQSLFIVFLKISLPLKKSIYVSIGFFIANAAVFCNFVILHINISWFYYLALGIFLFAAFLLMVMRNYGVKFGRAMFIVFNHSCALGIYHYLLLIIIQKMLSSAS